MLEPDTNSLEIMQNVCETSDSRSSSTSIDMLNYFQQCACQCHLAVGKNTVEELTAQKNDYLRQNIMVPISWAMAEVLKYEPSDPIHYMVYQLLRWKNNISQTEKDSIHEVIALATIAMDRKLILRKRLEEEKLIESMNEKAMENIPCSVCKDYQELRHIKQECWKCIKKPVRKYEICKFPQICSSCKIDVSDKKSSKKYEICEFPHICSSCKIDKKSSKKYEICEFPHICSSCKIDKKPTKRYEICEFPQICSSCKINEVDKITSRKHEICEFPQICSSCKINEVDKITLRKHEICEFPQMCSSCKINISAKSNNCLCLPHLKRASKE